MIRTLLCILPAAILAASPVSAQETLLRLDPAQTKIEFTLGSMLHTVHGTFQLKRGEIRFDPVTGKASGEVVVDAASGSSGNQSRDGRMHRVVLESERYPEIIFRPDRVEGELAAQGKSSVELHGSFSIHGAEHEVTVPVDVEVSDGQLTTDIHFSVPYVKWGLKNPSTLILRVGDHVDITIHTAARPAAR